jgi:hypothetical protein
MEARPAMGQISNVRHRRGSNQLTDDYIAPSQIRRASKGDARLQGPRHEAKAAEVARNSDYCIATCHLPLVRT